MAIPVFQPEDHPTRTNFNARIEAVNDELSEKLPKTGGEVSGPLKVWGKLTLGAGGDVFDIPYGSAVGYFNSLLLQGYSIDLVHKENYPNPIPVYGIATPTLPYGAANKAYVDGLVGDIASLLDSINGEVV